MSRQHEALMAVLDVADWHDAQAKSWDDSEPRLATVTGAASVTHTLRKNRP